MTSRDGRRGRWGGVGALERRRPGAESLALGTVLALLAALSTLLGGRGPGEGEAGEASVVALLLDQSASATRGRPGWQRWAVQQLAREGSAAVERGDDVFMLTFAEGVEPRFGPASAEEFMGALRSGEAAEWLAAGGPSPLGSDLAGAVEVALAAIEGGERRSGQLVVLGDGRLGGGGVPAALSDASIRGVQLLAPPAPLLPDVGVRAVQAPKRAEPGARVPVRLDLFLDGPALESSAADSLIVEWELVFRSSLRTEASRTLRGRETAQVPAVAAGAEGVRAFAVGLEVPPLTTGVGELKVSVRLGSLPAEVTDNFPENDQASTWLEIGDPVRVVVVSRSSGEPGVAGAPVGLPSGSAFDGIDFEFIAAPDLRPRLLGEAPPDVVLTLDIPLAGLPADTLSRFVLAGGGWVRGAGWTALRDEGSVLEPLLALMPDREPRRPMDIAFLVDGSGSMSGVRWDRVRDALGAIVPTASTSDRIELRFFSQVVSRPKLVFEPSAGGAPERAEARREAVEALMRARVPGGSTDILYSLDGLVAVREQRRPEEGGVSAAAEQGATQGLIVLITDGLTDSVWSLRQQVRARIVAAGDRLVIVQVGEDPDGVAFLAGLLMQGEAVLEAGELEGLEDLLHQELQDVRLVEGGRVVEAAGRPVARWLGELRSAALDAASLDREFVLGRALRCRPTEGAVALLDVEVPLSPGERGTFVAVAERGEGTVAGLALPSLGLGPDPWNPRLRSRLAWLAPVLRSMARRGASSERERQRGGSEDAGGRLRCLLTPAGHLEVRGLPAGLPARFAATIFGAATVDLFGELGPREALGTVTLSVPEVEGQPDRVRRGARPSLLDGVPRGAPLLLGLPAPADAVVFRADGPTEAFPEVGDDASWARGGPFGVGPGGALASAGTGGGPDEERGPGRSSPFTPWLLWGAILSLLVGGLGGPSALLRRAPRRNGHSPGGQGSRTGMNEPNGT